MPVIRNGSYLANALLVAIGAAAGAGVNMMVSPLLRQEMSSAMPQGMVKDRPPATRQALSSGAGGSLDNSSQKANAQGGTDSAMSEALQIQDLQDRAAAMKAAGMKAASENPAAALAMASSLASEQDKVDFLRGVYAVWSRSDPLAALEYAKSSLPPGTARNETIGIAMNRWGNADPRAAWQWAEQNLSGPLKDQALNDLMIGWTRQNPGVAAQWLASTGYVSQPMLNAVASTWAEQSPKAAASWASSLKSKEARRTAEVAAVTTWAEQSPSEAANYVNDRTSGSSTGDPASLEEAVSLASVIARIWGQSSPSEAAAWINKLGTESEKIEAASTLAMVWAASDIKGATAWSATISDPAIRRQVITHIATTWGAIEPDSALNWLATLPGDLTAEGVVGAYNSWAAVDAIGLREWVDSQPVSPSMDPARLSLADVLAESDITSSLTLAFGLSNPEGRDDAVARYFHEWRKVDDASAQEWLQQSWATLSTSTQERLTRELYRQVVAR